jgi:hypothetical protein
LNWNPVVGTKLLTEELRGQFSAEEAEVKYCLALVVLIRIKMKVIQHIVAQRLPDISTIELECEEHEADKRTNLVVKLNEGQ